MIMSRVDEFDKRELTSDGGRWINENGGKMLEQVSGGVQLEKRGIF